MFIRTDMIFSEIRKNTDLKRNSRRSVKHKSLRGTFHNNTVAAFFNHLCKVLLDRKRFRRRICRRDLPISDDRFDRTDKSYFMSDTF